jgi:hypothetical protein
MHALRQLVNGPGLSAPQGYIRKVRFVQTVAKRVTITKL